MVAAVLSATGLTSCSPLSRSQSAFLYIAIASPSAAQLGQLHERVAQHVADGHVHVLPPSVVTVVPHNRSGGQLADRATFAAPKPAAVGAAPLRPPACFPGL